MATLNFTTGTPTRTTKLVGFDSAIAGGERSILVGALLDVGIEVAPSLPDSNLKSPSVSAVKAFIAAGFAAASSVSTAGFLELKGILDCSANPPYPLALKGDGYKVSVAGRIGGTNGAVVQIGDFLTSLIDSASGTQAAVGANWFIVQANLTASVDYATPTDVGTAVAAEATSRATADAIVVATAATDATAKVAAEAVARNVAVAALLETSAMLPSSDNKAPSVNAVKAYVAANAGASSSSSNNFPYTTIFSKDPNAWAPRKVVGTAIDPSAFNSALPQANLSSVLGGVNVESIGARAFLSCNALASVSLPAATSVGGYAFSSCGLLSSVSLPAVTSVGNYAFQNCLSLTSIALPNVANIGGTVFYNCTLLNSISFPNVVTLGGATFNQCSSLVNVSLPNATTIGGGLFVSCSALVTVNVPNATSFGAQVFGNCVSLTSIKLSAPVSGLDGNAFVNSSIATIHVRPSPNTPAGWTAGAGQTIGGKSGITVVFDWTNYPN